MANIVPAGSMSNQEAIVALFGVYRKAGLQSNDPFEAYHKAAVEAISHFGEVEKNAVEALVFDNEGVLQGVPDEVRKQGDFETQFGFDNFISTIKGVLEGTLPVLPDYKGLVRQKLPPLEVYKFVGHNELEIKPSKKGYSFLFD